jgi:hypothetical protein
VRSAITKNSTPIEHVKSLWEEDRAAQALVVQRAAVSPTALAGTVLATFNIFDAVIALAPASAATARMSLVGFEVGGVDGRYGTKTEATESSARWDQY